MSSSSDQRSAHRRALDDLASLALGERVDPRVRDHVAGCPACRDELSRLRRVVGLARENGAEPPGRPGGGGPGPEVWSRIAAQTGVPAGPATPTGPARVADPSAAAPPAPAAPTAPTAPPRRLRRLALAAVAVVALAGAGVGGWAVGRSRGSATSGHDVVARLDPQPGTGRRAGGTATMLAAGDGYEMRVRTSGLPAPAGFYEVWLFDPVAGRMVAVGSLGPGGQGAFTLPAGLDVARYAVVDVSAQRYDGDPRHQRSVLRGRLAR